jgi:hypothetical protein
MSKIKVGTIRIACSLVLICSVLCLTVPGARAAAGRHVHVAKTFSAVSSVAKHNSRLAKFPRRALMAGESTPTGMLQALLVEAIIGAVGVGATIVVVNRRRHSAHPW